MFLIIGKVILFLLFACNLCFIDAFLGSKIGWWWQKNEHRFCSLRCQNGSMFVALLTPNHWDGGGMRVLSALISHHCSHTRCSTALPVPGLLWTPANRNNCLCSASMVRDPFRSSNRYWMAQLVVDTCLHICICPFFVKRHVSSPAPPEKGTYRAKSPGLYFIINNIGCGLFCLYLIGRWSACKGINAYTPPIFHKIKIYAATVKENEQVFWLSKQGVVVVTPSTVSVIEDGKEDE